MTNREAFNQLIREEMLEKVEAVEKMDTGLLVAAPRDFCIDVRVHDLLCVYKINKNCTYRASKVVYSKNDGSKVLNVMKTKLYS